MKVLIKKGKHAGREGYIVDSNEHSALIKVENGPDLPEIIELAWDGFHIISALTKLIRAIISLFKKNKS